MKKILLLSSVLILTLLSCEKDTPDKLSFNPQANGDDATAAVSGWFEVAPLPPAGRLGAIAFSIGNKAYAGLGVADNGAPPDFYEYDPATDKWTRKADFPGGNRTRATAFALGTKGYIVLGSHSEAGAGNGPAYDVWAYETTTNTWSRKADFPALPVFIPGSHASFTIGNRAYVGLACGDYDLYEYNPDTDQWTKKAKFPGGNRFGVVGFSVGTKGYIGLGIIREQFNARTLADIWEYDPATNQWTRKADFPGGPRGQAVAFAIGNKGYIASGIAEDGNYTTGLRDDLWEYDPGSDAWTLQNITGLPARAEAVGFSIGKTGFVGTGLNLSGSNYQSDFWKFNVE